MRIKKFNEENNEFRLFGDSVINNKIQSSLEKVRGLELKYLKAKKEASNAYNEALKSLAKQGNWEDFDKVKDEIENTIGVAYLFSAFSIENLYKRPKQ